MNGQTETVRLKVCSDAHTTRQIVNAARVQRTAYYQAIEWQVKARKVPLSVEAHKAILDDEKAKQNPRLKHGHRDLQYGGLVRASGRFRGWMGNPDATRTNERIPYESTERAERHGRVRCQMIQGIEITDQGTIEIAGLGELHIVGGARRRHGWSLHNVCIQETNRETPNEATRSTLEREFVVLMTLKVDHSAAAPRRAVEPRPERPTHAAKVEPDRGATECSEDDGKCPLQERQNRWTRRKGRREKEGSAHAGHSDRDGRQKGRLRNKGRSREWDSERY